MQQVPQNVQAIVHLYTDNLV